MMALRASSSVIEHESPSQRLRSQILCVTIRSSKLLQKIWRVCQGEILASSNFVPEPQRRSPRYRAIDDVKRFIEAESLRYVLRNQQNVSPRAVPRTLRAHVSIPGEELIFSASGISERNSYRPIEITTESKSVSVRGNRRVVAAQLPT